MATIFASLLGRALATYACAAVNACSMSSSSTIE